MPEDEKQISRNLTQSILPLWQYRAFIYRIKGLEFEEIAKMPDVDKHPDYVRSVFARGGTLYNFWREYVLEYKKEVKEQVMDMVWGHLADIIKAAILRAKQDGMVGNEAAKIIISLTLKDTDIPNVLQQNNIQINNIHVGPDEEGEIIDAVANFGIIKRNGNTNSKETDPQSQTPPGSG